LNLLTIYSKEVSKMSELINKNLIFALQSIRSVVSEQISPDVTSMPVSSPKPKTKPKKVMFDKSTGSPFEVIFSERGFLIEDTRMSFEDLETAISKNYNITLNGGKGAVLDAVKMQKILKYKDVI